MHTLRLRRSSEPLLRRDSNRSRAGRLARSRFAVGSDQLRCNVLEWIGHPACCVHSERLRPSSPRRHAGWIRRMAAQTRSRLAALTQVGESPWCSEVVSHTHWLGTRTRHHEDFTRQAFETLDVARQLVCRCARCVSLTACSVLSESVACHCVRS